MLGEFIEWVPAKLNLPAIRWWDREFIFGVAIAVTASVGVGVDVHVEHLHLKLGKLSLDGLDGSLY